MPRPHHAPDRARPWLGAVPSGQSVAIRASTTDKVSPGILVGTQVQLPRAGAHELYILYSLEADQSQVDVVLRVLALTSLPIILHCRSACSPCSIASSSRCA